MRRRGWSRGLGVMMALLMASGCTTTRAFSGGAMDGGKVSGAEDLSVDEQAEGYARYATGLVYEMQRDYEAARREFKLSVQADPTHVSLLLQVTKDLLSRDRAKEARNILEKATHYSSATNHLVYAYLGMAYAELGENGPARKANRRALELKPDSLQAYQNLAQLEFRAGNLDRVFAVLGEAATLESADPDFLLGIADLVVGYGRAGRLSGEKIGEHLAPIFDRLAEVPAIAPRQEIHWADLLANFGDPEAALGHYRSIQERFAEWPRLREKRVALLLRLGRRDEARRLIQEMLAVEPANPAGHIFMARLAEEDGELEEAAEHLDEAILVQPDLEPPYYNLSGIYLSLGRPEAALELLGRAQNRFQPTFLMEFYTALAYAQQHEYDQAILHYREAERIAEDGESFRLTPLFYYQVGSAYERARDYERCEEYMRKALELEPDFAEALNYLGYTWAELGIRLDEAHEMIARAVEKEPENAAFLDSLAWVLFKQQKPREALVPMLKAVAFSEDPDPTLFDHLGEIYASLGETEKARNAWEASLEIEDDPEIRRKLDGLAP